MAEETVVDAGITEAPSVGNEPADGATVDVGDNGVVTETNTENQSAGEDASQPDSTPAEVALDYNAVKLPEGVSVSDEDRAKFAEVVDRVGIKSQEGLQAFVDWIFETSNEGRAQMAKHAEAQAEASRKEWEEIKSGWKATLESDADFGKDYDLNIKRANDAMAKFGGSELSAWLKDADLIGHPALVRTFARIGKEIEDARLLSGSKSVETNKRPRDRYNQPMLTYKD